MSESGALMKAAATADWRKKLAAPASSIVIEEWGSCEIFFKPATLEQKNAVYQYIQKDDLQGIAETIVRRGLDGDGRKLFSNQDKKWMMKECDSEILGRIAMAINEEPESTVEEARKNSDSTRNSS
jgi:hypothetical protein